MSKIVFINPRWYRNGLTSMFIFRQMVPQGVYRLASLTPKEWQVEIIDENFRQVDFDAPMDVVAISATTALAPRAYEIAKQYQERGVPVIIGGVHASFCPEEAKKYADSVVIGEADEIWPLILADLKLGKLKPYYKAEKPPLLNNGSFLTEIPYNMPFFHIPMAQTSRGCPIGCDFCSVALFNGRKIRHRPITEVVNEISEFFIKRFCLKRYLIFSDDNIVADPQYALELFKAIRPLNLSWLAQSDIRIAFDGALLRGAVKSGLVALFIGFESIEKDSLAREVSLAKANWSRNYEEAISALHDEGVSIEGAFIFGLDHHTKDVFARTVEWVIKQRIEIAQFTLLTPFPGTKLFERLAKQNRITAKKSNGEYDWKEFSASRVVFQPKQMNQEELQEGLEWAYKAFYSYSSISSRLFGKIYPQKGGLDNLFALLANWDFRHFQS